LTQVNQARTRGAVEVSGENCPAIRYPPWGKLIYISARTGRSSKMGAEPTRRGAALPKGEPIMRVTVHLDTFDRIRPCGYAVLEIDREAREWRCTSQFGLNLPMHGPVIASAPGTQLCRLVDRENLCLLEGLDVFSSDGPLEGETGCAHWYGDLGIQPAAGHWHVELPEGCKGTVRLRRSE
jgi:hypothetical protein